MRPRRLARTGVVQLIFALRAFFQRLAPVFASIAAAKDSPTFSSATKSVSLWRIGDAAMPTLFPIVG